jgi:hypothetical protein
MSIRPAAPQNYRTSTGSFYGMILGGKFGGEFFGRFRNLQMVQKRTQERGLVFRRIVPGGTDAAELEEPFGVLVAAVFYGALNDRGDASVAVVTDLGESVEQRSVGVPVERCCDRRIDGRAAAYRRIGPGLRHR